MKQALRSEFRTEIRAAIMKTIMQRNSTPITLADVMNVLIGALDDVVSDIEEFVKTHSGEGD